MSGMDDSEYIRVMHRRNVEEVNAKMLADGVCVMLVPHPGGPVRAEYLWFAARPEGLPGNELPLCARCCAAWRESATRDSGMVPVRIVKI